MYFFKSKVRILVNEMTNILMKGIFHELYLFTHDYFSFALYPAIICHN